MDLICEIWDSHSGEYEDYCFLQSQISPHLTLSFNDPKSLISVLNYLY
jgi:hypothetical protein